MSGITLPLIPVDFGNCDIDGTVRLITRGTQEALEREEIILKEGLSIQLTDGELLAVGYTTFREGMWVAVVTEWTDNS